MKSLGSSHLRFCSLEQRDHKNRVIWFSGDFSLIRQQICCRRHQKLRDDVNLRISFKNKCVNPVSEAVPAQTNNEDKEIPTDSDPPKAVRVRFKLKKQCAFGEQFLVVGSDQILGLWDPSNGLSLNWSEDHVWIGEADLPSGKAVHYKFVLKAKTGTIIWQTGPDRVLEIWDTDRVISVFDDWDSPELQNIVEEDPLSNDVDEEASFEKLELSVVDENLSPPAVSNEDLPNVETMVAPNKLDDDSEAQETLSENSENKEENFRDDDDDYDDDDDAVITNGSDVQLRSKDEPRLVSDAPVLVPGLVPITEHSGTTEFIKAEENTAEITSIPYDKKVELKDERGPASAFEYSVETEIEEQQNDNEQEEPEDDNTETMKQHNMQWGRKTLEKFLASLGFQ